MKNDDKNTPSIIDCDTVLEILAKHYKVRPSELFMCHDSFTEQLYVEYVPLKKKKESL